MHRIKHNEIAPLVEKWLAETGQKIQEVLTASPSLDAAEDLESRLSLSEREYCRLTTSLWQTLKRWGVKSPDGKPWSAPSLSAAFRANSTTKQAKERIALDKLREKLRETTEAYLELPRGARELAVGRIEELETEILAMEERLSPMDARLAELRGELEDIKGRIEAARTACRGQNQRAKAQALSRVLCRIVCSFEHYQSYPKKKQTVRQKARPQGQDRSRLVSAFFEPLRGEGRELRAEGCGSAHR